MGSGALVPGSRFAAALGGATGFRASSVSAAVPPTSAKKPLLVLLGDGWRWDAGIFPEFTALWQRAERANVVVRSQSLPTCFAKGVATLAQGKRSAPGASHTTVLGRSLEAAHVNIITAGDVLARSLLGKQDSHHLTDSSFRNADPQVLAQLLRQVVQDSTGNRVVFLDMTLFSTAAQSQVLPELLQMTQDLGWNAMALGVSDYGACDKDKTTQNSDSKVDMVDASAQYPSSGTGPRLQAFAALGPDFNRGGAYSGSTHHTGLTHLPDVTATILSYFGAAVPRGVNGVPLVSQGEASIADLASAARRAALIYPAQYWFLPGLVGVLVLTLLGGVWSLNRRGRPLDSSWPQPRALLSFWRVAGLFAALLPASAFWINLLPWWELGPAQTEAAVAHFSWFGGLLPFALAAVVMLICTGFGLVSLLGPLGIISVYSLLIGFLDPFLSGRMMLDSLIGTQSTWGGRFYGIDNMMFAIFLTGALILTALIYGISAESNRKLLLAVLGFFAVAVVTVDALPSLGADFGGVLVAIPAFALLFLRLTTRRLKALLSAVILLFTLAVAAGLAYLDWLRPLTQRSHLGNFFDTVLHGEAWPVILEKTTQLWRAGWSPAMILGALAAFLVILFAMVWPLWRTWRNPYRRDYAWLRGREAGAQVPQGLEWSTWERATAAAWFLAMLLGIAVNDSSVLLGLAGFAVAAPAFLAQVTHRFLTETTPR